MRIEDCLITVRSLCAHRQLIQDDKGTVAICAFGLPYSSHEDDPLRGVLSALGPLTIVIGSVLSGPPSRLRPCSAH